MSAKRQFRQTALFYCVGRGEMFFCLNRQAGEVENTLKAIKWGIDYIVKSYVGKYELYGHVSKSTLSIIDRFDRHDC